MCCIVLYYTSKIRINLLFNLLVLMNFKFAYADLMCVTQRGSDMQGAVPAHAAGVRGGTGRKCGEGGQN